MPCYYPLSAYQSQPGSPLVFGGIAMNADKKPLQVPCGQCVGCRLERSRQWAIRCVHESSLYSRNCFITLTYNDENLPSDRSLHYDHFQKFMKRLRFSFRGVDPIVNADGEIEYPIRFYMCGEYGENFGRPHFHACLFNMDFDDKKLWMKSPSGSKIYRSKALEELWPFGFSSIGEVNFQSAAYVARYVMKKITGKAADAHYQGRTPEFTKMSLKPGIGAGWFAKYKSDVFKLNDYGDVYQDAVFVNGKMTKPPRYYDCQFKKSYPVEFDLVQQDRFEKSLLTLDDNTPERLKVKEQVTLAKLSILKRDKVN